ncbi:hypothetical protein B0H14DRAFT_3642254 [Mycena olivaceomarginata]|nr:hypothetical protein B0H14DRAFT_3642254 [Mycena olivaceomarginata]
MHLKVLGRSMIILDTYQAAVDLLNEKGLIYSDRPKFTLYELLGWNSPLGFLQYGKQFKYASGVLEPPQHPGTRTLVRNLIESAPERYGKSLSRFATGIITQIVAGHRIASDTDPDLYMSKMVYEAMAKTGPPGSSPLDFFPLRTGFPIWRNLYHLFGGNSGASLMCNLFMCIFGNEIQFSYIRDVHCQEIKLRQCPKCTQPGWMISCNFPGSLGPMVGQIHEITVPVIFVPLPSRHL